MQKLNEKDHIYLVSICYALDSDQCFDIPAANRNIHIVRTNGNVSVGRPIGARKLARPA